MLRLYDKKEELKTSKKNELMYEYFANNGFNAKDDIFNLEFELHRKYLKTYSIDTVDDLLGHAEKLFRECMDSIRLVDLSTISKNSVDTKNRYKAETHPLWQHISDVYKLKDFLAVDMPLERLKRKNYSYTIEDSIKEHIALARKFYIHGGIIDEQFYDEIQEAFERSIEPKYDDINKPVKLQTVYENINLRELNDIELEKYIKKLEFEMTVPDLDLQVLIKKHQFAYIELECRGKSLQQEFPF